jgi:hypothetical protein
MEIKMFNSFDYCTFLFEIYMNVCSSFLASDVYLMPNSYTPPNMFNTISKNKSNGYTYKWYEPLIRPFQKQEAQYQQPKTPYMKT